jgi:hypothetical protein
MEDDMTHTMRVMGIEGDTKLIWDSDNEIEVETARDTFNKLTKKGFKAFAVRKKGEQGEMVTEFDPDMEKIILAAPISGG